MHQHVAKALVMGLQQQAMLLLLFCMMTMINNISFPPSLHNEPPDIPLNTIHLRQSMVTALELRFNCNGTTELAKGMFHLLGHFFQSIGFQEKNCNLFIFRTPFSIEMAMLEKIVKNSVLVVFN